MSTPRPAARRPPVLVALQTEATLLMSLAIGQAGLASGFLSGHKGLKGVHEINGFVLAALTVVTLLTAVLYVRQGGPRWPAAAAGLLLLIEVVQIVLGEVEAKGPHIFLGVLFVVCATLYTSYLFRPGFIPARTAA
ncbi:MAG: hypothetical protein ABWX96_19155 [Propionibacteriaceae bacterium]